MSDTAAAAEAMFGTRGEMLAAAAMSRHRPKVMFLVAKQNRPDVRLLWKWSAESDHLQQAAKSAAARWTLLPPRKKKELEERSTLAGEPATGPRWKHEPAWAR